METIENKDLMDEFRTSAQVFLARKRRVGQVRLAEKGEQTSVETVQDDRSVVVTYEDGYSHPMSWDEFSNTCIVLENDVPETYDLKKAESWEEAHAAASEYSDDDIDSILGYAGSLKAAREEIDKGNSLFCLIECDVREYMMVPKDRGPFVLTAPDAWGDHNPWTVDQACMVVTDDRKAFTGYPVAKAKDGVFPVRGGFADYDIYGSRSPVRP